MNINKCIKMKSLLLVSALLLTTGLPAAAEKAEDKKTTMDDTVATAMRIQERPVDVPVVTEVITQEKIEMSGVTHIGDLIGKYITGHYHKYNGLLSPAGRPAGFSL